jgi:hypothetical protein
LSNKRSARRLGKDLFEQMLLDKPACGSEGLVEDPLQPYGVLAPTPN